MGWYTYGSNTIYSFKSGVDGDVLYIPCGIQSVAWAYHDSYNQLDVHGWDGGTQTIYTDQSNDIVFCYSTDGWSTPSIALPTRWGGYAGSQVNYDPNVNSFWGIGTSELKVSDNLIHKNDGSYAWNYNKTISLDGQLGWQSYSGITNINAQYSSGNNNLWGDWQDNKIVDGYGNSGLWGGWGGNDTLTGGDGNDTFFYEYNGGHDVITDANNGDTIYLFNIIPWQSDVSCWYDGENNIMYMFTPAGQLDVHCSNGTPWPALPVYQYSDGSRWQYIWNGVNSNDNWHQISYDAIEDMGADIAANPLWGNANEFFGTAQADNIFVSRTDGNDLVFDTDGADTVHLYDAALSDIVSTSVSDNAITIEFNTGEVAMVSAAENTSPTFKLASGESYVYNREISSWQEA